MPQAVSALLTIREVRFEANAIVHKAERGFTLIELSIVLVIIGLIVGGVLVGQSLIGAATIRSQVTQIEKFNQAANTFFGKYGALPGDISATAVTQFGFTTVPIRLGTAGGGDANGELDGGGPASWVQSGESLYFWIDLSSNSNLIEGAFSGNNSNCASATVCNLNYPYAKIGNGASVYVYSGYAANYVNNVTFTGFGPNFFGISMINSMAFGNVSNGATPPAPALTVAQAYAIDSKIDDGKPKSGNVLAQYIGGTGGYPIWSASGGSATASTCFDTSSGTAAYSIGYQNGALVNCGLSLKIQAGD